jgi:hypothetical protein
MGGLFGSHGRGLVPGTGAGPPQPGRLLLDPEHPHMAKVITDATRSVEMRLFTRCRLRALGLGVNASQFEALG